MKNGQLFPTHYLFFAILIMAGLHWATDPRSG
jgi:hypothetical protein